MTTNDAGARITVALDAMGGDRAPAEPVAGALAAARGGLRVILVGDEARIVREMAGHVGTPPADLEVVHAPDRIFSEEDGARAVRSKPESSLVVACRLVAEGRAQAVMSSGHTGAMLAAATLHLRRVPGVLRPGLAVVLPSIAGPIVLLDAGANADCRAEHLAQFALMGRLLAEDVLGIPDPSVGLLSIGEEAGKGSELVQQTFPLLEGTKGFIGNVEGRDIPRGTARVVVTDGFTGNVALKLYEGTGAMIFREIRTSLQSTWRGRAAAVAALPTLRSMRRFVDPEEYGGAYLLGVRGLAVIGHGNFGGRGIANALRLSARGAREGMVEQLEAGLRGAA